MKFILAQIVIVFVIALSSSAFAEIYVWEDEAGSHAASDPKDVPPEVLKKYGKSLSSEEQNVPKTPETITKDTNDKSLSAKSKEYSESLAIKLDSYKSFLSSNPSLKDVAVRYEEIESLFSIIDDTCKQMGDASTYKLQGEYVKAAEVEICNDRRYTLAPFVANSIVNTAKYYADKGNKTVAKKMYRDVIVRFTGSKYKSQVKEAEFGLEDLK
jgi:hypothetical protein